MKIEVIRKLRASGSVIEVSDVLPQNGVLFLTCNWSAESIMSSESLIRCIGKFPELDLYVLDIDSPIMTSFYSEYEVKSHGKGEIFGFNNGKLIFKHVGNPSIMREEGLRSQLSDLNDQLSSY
jgi:hypothetical protein